MSMNTKRMMVSARRRTLVVINAYPNAQRSRARPRRPDRRREDEQHQQHRLNHDPDFAALPHQCDLMQHVKAASTCLPPPRLSLSAFVRNDMCLFLRAFGHLPAIAFELGGYIARVDAALSVAGHGVVHELGVG